jgi:hypothetical protein
MIKVCSYLGNWLILYSPAVLPSVTTVSLNVSVVPPEKKACLLFGVVTLPMSSDTSPRKHLTLLSRVPDLRIRGSNVRLFQEDVRFQEGERRLLDVVWW